MTLTRRQLRLPGAALATLTMAFLWILAAAPAEASTAYLARLGSTHGAARLTLGSTNTVYVNAKALARGTWTEALYMGTCAKPSTRIRTLSPLTVGRTMNVARTDVITASQGRLARSGVLRLTRGTSVVCGSFALSATPVASASPAKPSPTKSPATSPKPSGSAGASPSRTAGPSGSAPATSAPTGTGAPTSTATTGSTPMPTTAVLPFEQTGRGDGSTPTFSAPLTWTIGYAFDCSETGQSGQFRIDIYTNGRKTATAVDVTGTDGGSQLFEVARSGSTWLQVVSPCDWYVGVDAT